MDTFRLGGSSGSGGYSYHSLRLLFPVDVPRKSGSLDDPISDSGVSVSGGESGNSSPERDREQAPQRDPAATELHGVRRVRVSNAAYDLVSTLCTNERAKSHTFRDMSKVCPLAERDELLRRARMSETRSMLLEQVVRAVAPLRGDI